MAASSLLLKFLDAVRRRIRRAEVLASLNFFLAAVLLLLLGGVVGDHAVGFPVGVRVGLFLLLVVSSVSFLAVAVIRPLFMRLTHPYCARLIERRIPEIKGSLLAFAELPDKETPLAEALAERALEKLEGRHPADFAPAGRIMRSFVLFAAAFLLSAVYCAFSPKSVTLSLKRLVFPTAAIAEPTATRIVDVKPGDAVVLSGSDVYFKVSTSGEPPAGALVSRRMEDGGKERITLTAVTPSDFEAVLPSAVASFDYYVEAGDASAGPFKITVHPVPVITETRFRIIPPSYTGIPPFEETGGQVRFPAGSKVDVSVATATPIEKAWVFLPGSKIPMRKAGSKSAILTLSPESSLVVSFRYADTGGFTSEYAGPVRLIVLPDRAPLVTIRLPLDGSAVPFNMPFTVKGSAADDYGLSAVFFHYSVNGGPWVEETLPLTESAKEVEMRLSVVAERKGWKAGDKVSLRFSALDNAEPENERGFSEIRTVTVEPPPPDDMNPPPPDGSESAETVPKKRDGKEKTGQPEPEDVEKKLKDMAEKDRKALERIKKELEKRREEKKGEENPPPRTSEGPRPSPLPSISPSGAPPSASPRSGRPRRSASPASGGRPRGSASPPAVSPRASGGAPRSSPGRSPAVPGSSPAASAPPSASGSPSPSKPPSTAGGSSSPKPGGPKSSASPSPLPGGVRSLPPSLRPSGSPAQPRASGAPQKSPSGSVVPSVRPDASGRPSASAAPRASGKASAKPRSSSMPQKTGGGTRSAIPKSPAGGTAGGSAVPPRTRTPASAAPGTGSKKGSPKPGASRAPGGPKASPSPAGTATPKAGDAGTKPGDGKRRTGADDVEKLLEEIEKALREGRLTEADLKRAGLTRERLEQYRRLLRMKKILRREVEGSRNTPGQKIAAGDVSAGVGGKSGVEKGEKSAKEARRSEERVSGTYRSLIEAFRRSRRKGK